MSEQGSTAQSHQLSSLKAFRLRCRGLGVFVWLCTTDGSIVDQPQETGSVGLWLRSPLLDARIRQTAQSQAPPGVQPPVDLSGCGWVVSFSGDELPSHVRVLTLILNVGGTESEWFEAVCAAGAVDKNQARGEWASLPRYRGDDLGLLAKTLHWSLNDLVKANQDGRILEEFSSKLVQSYEETHFLFTLARHLNCVTSASQTIEATCNLMVQVLPFRWIAVQFGQGPSVLFELTGRSFVAGTLPFDQGFFEDVVGEMIRGTSSDQWSKLVQPGQNKLATAANSEIVVEAISHGDNVVGYLLAGNNQADDPEISSVEMQVLDAVANFLCVFHENASRFHEQKVMFLETLGALTAALDAKDPYTQGHSERVGLLGSQLALAHGFTPEQAERVRISGLLHDIGKIGVPESILLKTGWLTPEEFQKMKAHPVIGHQILQGIHRLHDTLPGVLYHHERWDGCGYPKRLRGEEIPILGRLLALADAFDAMSSTRSYRTAMPRDKVLTEIAVLAGMQFDPRLTKLFLSLDLTEYDQAVARHQAAAQAQAVTK